MKEKNKSVLIEKLAHKFLDRFQILGLLPFAFFIARLFELKQKGAAQDIFWVCHFSNLTLAIGILFFLPTVIRASLYWLVCGLPLWVWWLIQAGTTDITSAFTHIGGLIIGFIALAKVRVTGNIWLHAFSGFILLQQYCRWFTPEKLNINMSQNLYVEGVYVGGEKFFNVYWQYWLGTLLIIAFNLWLIERILMKVFPENQNQVEEMN
ncbi:MAG: hypothetical protein AB1757_21785 [Acidobacteriota bacterium]